MQRFPTSSTASTVPLTQPLTQSPHPHDSIPVGTFSPPLPTDLRSTCPILNALSNHGLVPRSGRDVSAAQLHHALRQIGVSPELAYLATLGNFVTSPPAAVLKAGNAQAAHKDDKGVMVIDYSLLNVGPGYVEHDVSLTRQDRLLGDPVNADPALVKQFVGFRPENEGFALTDTTAFRKRRYHQQVEANKGLRFGMLEHAVVCAETTGLHNVFGKGWRYEIPRSYLKALFEDERLPIEEGWRVRTIPFTIVEAWFVWVFVWVAAWPFRTWKSLQHLLS